MWAVASPVCVIVVVVVVVVAGVASCARTGDDLFRKLPDAAVADGGITVDAGVDAGDVPDAEPGAADANEPDADLGIIDARDVDGAL